MSGTEEGAFLMVKCKWCGTMNRKHRDHSTAKCKECKKVTAYIIPIKRRR